MELSIKGCDVNVALMPYGVIDVCVCFVQIKSKVLRVCDFADNPEGGDNQDMQNYFRQASVNLKDILKNPGVWDPFILSYVDVSVNLPDLIAKTLDSNVKRCKTD